MNINPEIPNDFEKYERQPQEVQNKDDDQKIIKDWNTQLDVPQNN